MQSANDHETLARLHYSLQSRNELQNADNEYHMNSGCKREAEEAGLDLDQPESIGISSDEDACETPKKSPPPNGKKTKGRVKIKMEFIDNKLRRYTTFSKRKTGIMKKAYELSTLTGTQVMLLVASETGHVYTFATRKLQPMITSEAGKALIQTCLNSPDPLLNSGLHADQRMSATGFEETELTYSINDEESKLETPKSQGLYGVNSQMDSPSHHSSSLAHISGTNLLNSQTSPNAKSNNTATHLQPTATNFTTILAQGAIPSGTSLQLGSLPSMHSSPGNNGHTGNNHHQQQQQALYKLGQPGVVHSSGVDTPTHNTVTIVPTPQQNLTVSGNMVNLSPVSTNSTSSVSGTVMYQTSQGVVYASPSGAGLSEGLIFNLGQSSALQLPQETGGSSSGHHQFITIPVSLTPSSQIVKAPSGISESNGVTVVAKNNSDIANPSKSTNRK